MSPTAEDNNSVDTKQYKKYIYKPVSVSQEIDSNQCDKNSKEDTQQSTMEDRIIFNSQNLKIPESINTENGSKFLQYFAAIAGEFFFLSSKINSTISKKKKPYSSFPTVSSHNL